WPEAPRGGPGEAVRLEASATTRGQATTARAPQVLKRTASLWMYRSVDYWPAPELDVDSVDVIQDVRAKKVTATVTFDAPPTAERNSLVWVYLGTWNAAEDNCSGAVGVVGAGHGSSSDAGFGSVDGSTATVSRSLSGSTLTLTASGAAAGNQ